MSACIPGFVPGVEELHVVTFYCSGDFKLQTGGDCMKGERMNEAQTESRRLVCCRDVGGVKRKSLVELCVFFFFSLSASS